MKKEHILKACRILLIVLLLLFTILYNFTPLFLKTGHTAEGWLSYRDYILLDKNGTPVQSVPGIRFPDSYVFSSDSEPERHTTYGIAPGDTWDAFVKAYGSSTASYIACYPTDETSTAEAVYAVDCTINDFNEQYMKNSDVDPAQYEICITFEIKTCGSSVYITSKEKDSLMDKYYDHMISIGSFDMVFGMAKIHEIDLYFTFEPVNDVSTLDYISSYTYGY